MRENYTHVALILDRSGSMAGLEQDVRGGINRLLDDQRKIDGPCTVSLVLFDTEFQQPYFFRALAEVPALGSEYYVRGATALYDALGRTIDATGARLRELPEAARPGKVVIVVYTDGLENSSREWTSERLRAAIERQQHQYNWQFVFLGSSQDAVLAAKGLGFGLNSTMFVQHTGQGYRTSYDALSANLCSVRVGASATMDWSDAQRSSAANGSDDPLQSQKAKTSGEAPPEPEQPPTA